MLIIGLAIVVVGLLIVAYDLIGPYRRRNRPIAAHSNSPIGYKRAILTLDDHAFTGVTDAASPYSCDEVRAPGTPGFYSYYKLEDALAHPQRGTVYLETLAHGQVHHHELGMTAERQRVLQVLIGKCTECGREQADYWVQKPPREGEEAGAHLLFTCIGCSEVYRNPLTFRQLEDLLNTYCEPGHSITVGTIKPSALGSAFIASEVH